MSATDDLISRFDALRNSGICSPTTRGLLDDAQRLLTDWEYEYRPTTDDYPNEPEWARRPEVTGYNAYRRRRASDWEPLP